MIPNAQLSLVGRGRSEHQVISIRFTPELAQKWLACNTRNRHMREPKARAYAQDMINGDWHWTGDPLRVTDTGELRDGQHRLRGLVLAGIQNPDLEIEFLVVTIADDAVENIDTGISRKLHDILHLRGERDSAALAAVIAIVDAWADGSRRSLTTGAGTHRTNAQKLHRFEEHPELREITRESRRLAPKIDGLASAVIGLLLWVFERVDNTSAPEDARFFFERLADGQGLVAGDAIYELRKTLDAIAKSPATTHSRAYIVAVCIKAWNAYRRGEQIGILRWRAGGAKPEPFPEPI